MTEKVKEPLTELEVFRKGMKAMGKAMKKGSSSGSVERAGKAWSNTIASNKFKDGGSVESYMNRNDGGMAKKTRCF